MAAIIEYISQCGYPPTMWKIGKKAELKSTSGNVERGETENGVKRREE